MSPSREMRRHERFDRLQASVGKLNEDHRQVILLSRIEGLRIREIAARMNRSETAIRSLLFRALKELRKSLAETESLRLPQRSLTEETES